MSKLDLNKELKYLYKPSAKEIMLVDLPSLNFVMADGKGDPNTSQDFQDIINALYGISYTLKFDLKKKGIGPDYIVMPLEGLWWMEGQEEFDMEVRDQWQWTLMKFLEKKVKDDEDEIASNGTLYEERAIPLILKSQFNHDLHLDLELTELRVLMNRRFQQVNVVLTLGLTIIAFLIILFQFLE